MNMMVKHFFDFIFKNGALKMNVAVEPLSYMTYSPGLIVFLI